VSTERGSHFARAADSAARCCAKKLHPSNQQAAHSESLGSAEDIKVNIDEDEQLKLLYQKIKDIRDLQVVHYQLPIVCPFRCSLIMCCVFGCLLLLQASGIENAREFFPFSEWERTIVDSAGLL